MSATEFPPNKTDAIITPDSSLYVQEYGDPVIGEGGGSGVLPHGEAPPAVPGPTPCLCIDNMVREAVFAEEEEYQVRASHPDVTHCHTLASHIAKRAI